LNTVPQRTICNLHVQAIAHEVVYPFTTGIQFAVPYNALHDGYPNEQFNTQSGYQLPEFLVKYILSLRYKFVHWLSNVPRLYVAS
jgi:hypothetical protein